MDMDMIGDLEKAKWTLVEDYDFFALYWIDSKIRKFT